MKIVKLNGRHKQFREHGHVVAMRFDSVVAPNRNRYELACQKRWPGHGQQGNDIWYSYIGTQPARLRELDSPFWITFRNEYDLTILLLTVT